jgi:MoaA/NifB/PqqE/SkfB family radical SAM enzyme
MTNPFQPLYDIQNAGNSPRKLAVLPDFPRLVDLELTNSCNFRCLMCPTGNLSQTRAAGFMEVDQFECVVDQCAEHGTAIRLIGWGEPTMHPQFHRLLRYAKERHVLVHVNTNGYWTNPVWWAEMLVNGGLDSIKFSFQGVDQASYAEMRNKDWFDGLFDVVKTFHSVRGERSRPFIHVSTSITDEDDIMVEKFRNKFAAHVDQLSVGRTVFDYMDWKAARLRPADRERLERLAGLETTRKVHPDCPEVYDKLSIAWDGSVRTCCNDYDGVTDLGSADDLAKAWNHPVIGHYRKNLADGLYIGPLCSNCFDYMGTNKPNSQEI